MANKIINGFENYIISKVVGIIKYWMIVKSYLSNDSFMIVNLTLEDKHYNIYVHRFIQKIKIIYYYLMNLKMIIKNIIK